MRLKGKTALITAAGGAMGAAVAARFAREGAGLIMTDISENRLGEAAEAARKLLKKDAELIAFRADATREEETAELAALAQERFGHVDILVNVVGGIPSGALFESLIEMSEARWRRTFEMNLDGIFFLVRRLGPAMLDNRYGKIVNISSINFAGEAGHADYGAAKAAVSSLTRSLAIEMAPHVNVNAIAPGIIETSVVERMDEADVARYRERNLLKRLGRPEDIANAALFLASDEASFVTGVTLAVSGGIWPSL